MLELLSWLESTALAGWLRGAGVWTYGLINLGHITGISALFGSVLLLDLKLLGLWRSLPLAAVARPTVPLAIFGFVLASLSGICMISFNASEYHGNPFLLVKFPAIGLGLINVVVVSRMRAWRRMSEFEPAGRDRAWLAVAGGVSLACWGTALAGGRMLGYW